MITRTLPKQMVLDNINKRVLFALEYSEKQECWNYNHGDDILYNNKSGYYPICLMISMGDAEKFCDYIDSKFPNKKGLTFMTVLEEFTNYLNQPPTP